MPNLPYPDLVWTAGGIIGGFLLIENASGLTKKGKAGVWLIFGSFMFQVYWAITHPWVEKYGWWEVGYVTLMLVVGLIIFLRSMNKRKNTS